MIRDIIVTITCGAALLLAPHLVHLALAELQPCGPSASVSSHTHHHHICDECREVCAEGMSEACADCLVEHCTLVPLDHRCAPLDHRCAPGSRGEVSDGR